MVILMVMYPLVDIEKAMEHGAFVVDRNLSKWWFSIVIRKRLPEATFECGQGSRNPSWLVFRNHVKNPMMITGAFQFFSWGVSPCNFLQWRALQMENGMKKDEWDTTILPCFQSVYIMDVTSKLAVKLGWQVVSWYSDVFRTQRKTMIKGTWPNQI